jgi:hypothetical protein
MEFLSRQTFACGAYKIGTTYWKCSETLPCAHSLRMARMSCIEGNPVNTVNRHDKR